MENLNCPKCGKTFETEYALSSHGAQEHGMENVYEKPEIREAMKKIKRAYIAGFISTALTAIVAVSGLLGRDAWSLLDAALFLGLSFGIYKNNRGCAVAIFVLWIIDKIVLIVQNPSSWTGLPVAIIFGYFFYGGIKGTFEYKRITDPRKISCQSVSKHDRI